VAQPGRQPKPIVLVEDNGPIHTSKRSLAALAARAHWLTVDWLPKYAPCLNKIEPVWRDLRPITSPTRPSRDVNALDLAIHDAVIDLSPIRWPRQESLPSALLPGFRWRRTCQYSEKPAPAAVVLRHALEIARLEPPVGFALESFSLHNSEPAMVTPNDDLNCPCVERAIAQIQV
jgi:transposase